MSRKSIKRWTGIFATTIVVLTFQNCGDGFTPMSLTELGSGGGPILGDNSIRTLASVNDFSDSGCCGVFDLYYPGTGQYAYSTQMVPGLRVNVLTGQAAIGDLRTPLFANYPYPFWAFVTDVSVGLNGQLQLIDPNTLKAVKNFPIDQTLHHRVAFQTGAKRHVLIQRSTQQTATTPSESRSAIAFDRVTETIVDLGLRGQIFPIQDSELIWHHNLDVAPPVVELFDVTQRQVIQSFPSAGSFIEIRGSIAFQISNGTTQANVFNLGTAMPRSYTFSGPSAVGAIVGDFAGQAIYGNGTTGAIEMYNPANQTATPIVPADPDFTPVQYKLFGDKLIVHDMTLDQSTNRMRVFMLPAGTLLSTFAPPNDVSPSILNIHNDRLIISERVNNGRYRLRVYNFQGTALATFENLYAIRADRINDTSQYFVIYGRTAADWQAGVFDFQNPAQIRVINDLSHFYSLQKIDDTVRFYDPVTQNARALAGNAALENGMRDVRMPPIHFNGGAVQLFLACRLLFADPNYACELRRYDRANQQITVVYQWTSNTIATLPQKSRDGIKLIYACTTAQSQALCIYNTATNTHSITSTNVAPDDFSVRASLQNQVGYSYSRINNVTAVQVLDSNTGTFKPALGVTAELFQALFPINESEMLNWTAATGLTRVNVDNGQSTPILPNAANIFSFRPITGNLIAASTSDDTQGIHYFYNATNGSLTQVPGGYNAYEVSENWMLLVPSDSADPHMLVNRTTLNTVSFTLPSSRQVALGLRKSAGTANENLMYEIGGFVYIPVTPANTFVRRLEVGVNIFRVNTANGQVEQVTNFGENNAFVAVEDFLVVGNRIALLANHSSNYYKNALLFLDIQSSQLTPAGINNYERCALGTATTNKVYFACNTSMSSPTILYEKTF